VFVVVILWSVCGGSCGERGVLAATFLELENTPGFWDLFFVVAEEGIPQGLKPLSLCVRREPKAKALGYLEATAEAKSRR
jgi:hypothetical protein